MADIAWRILWIGTISWIAFGFWMKVLGVFSGSDAGALRAIITWGEIAVDVGVLALAIGAPMACITQRAVVCTLSVFTAVHVLMLFENIKHCGCFGTLVMPEWAMLGINAGLLINVTIVRLYTQFPPIPRWAIGCIHPLILIPAILLTKGGHRVFDIATIGSPNFRVGEQISLIDPSSPAMRWIVNHVSDVEGTVDILLYDPSCQACRRMLPIFTNRALTESTRAHHLWEFINIGDADDPQKAILQQFAFYTQVPDGSITPPIHLRIQRGVVKEMDASESE